MLLGLLMVFLVSFAVCYFLIRFNPFGHRAYDPISGGPQKFHVSPVPRVGGVAILVSLFVYSLVSGSYWLLLLCSLPAFFGGLLEDITKRVGVKKGFF